MNHMIFDAHLHIIDPAYPLVSNEGYLPDPYTVDDYVGQTVELGIGGGAVVSGSFQSFDQSYLQAALANLGPHFVGVTQLPLDVSDESLIALDACRVRALRFNMRRGGREAVEHLSYFAERVHEMLGWHAEIYCDSRYLEELEDALCRLPAVSIDHLGLSKKGPAAVVQAGGEGRAGEGHGIRAGRFCCESGAEAPLRYQSSGADVRHRPAVDPFSEAVQASGYRDYWQYAGRRRCQARTVGKRGRVLPLAELMLYRPSSFLP